MKKIANFTLQNGVTIPAIGFGTWQISDPETAYHSTLEAIKCGYLHIDTAAAYGNEKYIGDAIKDSNIPRNKLFITTKLWNKDHTYKKALNAIEKSLKNLQTDYVDLYLVHWPNPIDYRDNFENAIKETWWAMEEIYKTGKAKAIGISNFKPHHIETLLEYAEIAPMVNQIRLYPGFEDEATVKVSKKHGMILEAYSPFGTGKIFDSKELKFFSLKYNKTIAQICIRFLLQKGYLPLPKSQTPSRIKENIDVFDFIISDEDMIKINNIENCCGLGSDPDTCNF